MLLYSTKSIKCKGDGESFIIPCHEMIDAPEWVRKTDEYKMASEDGCLTETNSKKKKIAAENGDIK